MKRITVFFKKNVHIILPGFFALIVLLCGIIIFANSHGSVVINEVCTSNVSCCMDENGQYPDWIEIYNPTQEPVDISGYVVNKTTDLKKEKFTIPEGTILDAGSFYLFDPVFTVGTKGGTLNLLDVEKHYIDRVTVPKLKYDTTYARQADGADSWEIRTPTPGYSNSDGEELDPVLDGKVKASVKSGFYDEDFDLTLRSSDWGREIYYTTDGSDPVTNGVLYEAPIRIRDRSTEANVYSGIKEVSLYYTEGQMQPQESPVDKCTVVRAVARDHLGRFTDIYTFTYFVGFSDRKSYDDITVVAVSADPDDLFSNDNGIMVLGQAYDDYVNAGKPEEYDRNKANFTLRGRRSERFVNVEIFNEDHEEVLKADAAIKIKGMSSRWDEQKSLSVIFRKAYGGKYRESFTADGKDFDLHSFALDKCGQDSGTMMVDTLMTEVMSQTNCATAQRIPACLFINGEYWGFYWLTERFDRAFFADKYGVDKDDVVTKNMEDFTSDGEWNVDNFDREALIDYYAANIIVAHGGDWPGNNVRYWKTETDEGTPFGDGKLRAVIFDMNSHSMKDPKENVFDCLMERYYPFMKLTGGDDDFRKDIADRIDKMCEGELAQDKMLERIDVLYDMIRDQMVLNNMRFSNCSEEEALRLFDESVEDLRNFYRERYGYLEGYKEAYLNGE